MATISTPITGISVRSKMASRNVPLTAQLELGEGNSSKSSKFPTICQRYRTCDASEVTYLIAGEKCAYCDHPRSCLFVCRYSKTITFESLDVGSSYLHIQYISREDGSSSYMKVTASRSRSLEQKKVANACSCADQLPSAIFISTRHITPQTTRREWLRLRLDRMLIVVVVVVVMCLVCACLAGSIHDEGVGTGSGQTNAWMRVCRLHSVEIQTVYQSYVQRACSTMTVIDISFSASFSALQRC